MDLNGINQILPGYTGKNSPAVSKTAEKTATDKTAKSTDTSEVTGTATYGSPRLSEKAQAYYDDLKKKYGDLNFVLVASDKKEEADAQKGSFASAGQMTVLIDTDKIERMASDEQYRKQIEGTIQSAVSGISELSQNLGTSANASGVTAFGMTVNQDGTASYFAVVDESLSQERKRIEETTEKNQEKKAEAKKTAEKKAAQKAQEKKAASLREETQTSGADRTKTITASSIEELMDKLQEEQMNQRTNQVQTAAEKNVGQSVDYQA